MRTWPDRFELGAEAVLDAAALAGAVDDAELQRVDPLRHDRGAEVALGLCRAHGGVSSAGTKSVAASFPFSSTIA